MGNATVEINTNLLGANDLLLGEGRVLQRRYGQDVPVQKLNLSFIPGTDEFPQFTKSLLQALQSKVNSEPGKGLSSNDFSDAEKAKLATISAAASCAGVYSAASGVYSAAASVLAAWEGVRAAKLEIFDTKEQIEQSALSAAEKLDAVRSEAVAALRLIEQAKDEGVESVNIAASVAQNEISDKQNIAETTIIAAQNNALLRVEQAKDAGRQSINALTQGITDDFVNLSVTIRNDINTTASNALDDIGTKIDDANDAAALAVSKTAVLNTTIDTANTALAELHDPQTDLKLLYVSASGALYTAAAQSAFTEMLIQRAIASLHTYAASVYAAEAEADRVEIAGYKTDITAMMAQMQILLDNTKTAEQNAEFIALKEAFD